MLDKRHRVRRLRAQGVTHDYQIAQPAVADCSDQVHGKAVDDAEPADADDAARLDVADSVCGVADDLVDDPSLLRLALQRAVSRAGRRTAFVPSVRVGVEGRCLEDRVRPGVEILERREVLA